MSDIAETLDERGKRYGEFKHHAEASQSILQAIKQGFAFNAVGLEFRHLPDDMREALQMIAHKLGRITNGDPDYADSWVDIAGYAKLISDRLEEDGTNDDSGEVS